MVVLILGYALLQSTSNLCSSLLGITRWPCEKGMQLKLKPQCDFLTKFISPHYYFTPEGQFETNVGQKSQCVKLAFTYFHSKPSNYLKYFSPFWGFKQPSNVWNICNVSIKFEFLENQKKILLLGQQIKTIGPFVWFSWIMDEKHWFLIMLPQKFY